MSAPVAVIALVGGAVLVLLLVQVVPPVLLRLVVRSYPLEHPRRAELLRELDDVAPGERLRWVVGLAGPCAREGADARRAHQHSEPQRRRVARYRLGGAVFLSAVCGLAGAGVVSGVGAVVAPATTTGPAAAIAGCGFVVAQTVTVVLVRRHNRRRPDAD